jgi:hypothetical protein
VNDSIGFYDEVARVGSEILEMLAGSSAADRAKDDVSTYLDLVAQIYNLLTQVHDQVATVAVRVTVATTLAEARQDLQGIGHTGLEDTFRAMDWCDQFEKLGKDLRPLREDPGLSPNDQKIWDEFCETLEQREGEVAMLYDHKLYDLRRLASDDLSLETLKQEVDQILEQLVTQKARFDLLAKRAKAMRAQIR